jgi:hypothetical protein
MEFLLQKGVGILAIGLPIIIVGIVFYFDYKKNQDKNKTLIELAKSFQNKDQIEGLLNSFETKKTSSLQMKRGGINTLFTGIGFFLFGLFFLGHILKGVGALITFIGLGVFLAGYLFPDKEEN